GMSGGPVWRYVSGNRYIMTVHAYGRDGTDSNFGTRLNSDKYDRINTWLSADASSAPTDKPDLEDRGSSYSDYNINTVTPGVTSFNVYSDVRNKGTTSSGGFYIYYYASTNNVITTLDYFIGSDYVSSISAFGYSDSSWSGIFPSDIPAGNYYIGWIIDSPDWVDEFDENNNDAYKSSQITVNPPPPPPPGYIEIQVNDSDTSGPVNFAYLQIWVNGSNLVDTGLTSSIGFYNSTALDIGAYNISVSKPGYHTQNQLINITDAQDDYYLDFAFVSYPPDSSYIEVRVNESNTLNPIGNAYIRTYNTTSGELWDSGYTNSSGFYNITGLYIGWWTVNVSFPGFHEQSKVDYINWNFDDDYLHFYLDSKFRPINGPVAIFRDNFPWNVNATEPILEKYNISYTIYNSLDFGNVDLSSFNKVILASEQVQTFYDRLAGNVSWFEDYAANGGVLELHTVDRKGNPSYHNGTWNAYLYPGGINKTYNVEFVNNSMNMPLHPILLKPFTMNESQIDGYIGGVFTVYPVDAREILHGPTADPILIEFSYGSGYIIASTQTLEWNANWGGSQQLYENIILYNPLDYDYSISITAPFSSTSWETNQTYNIMWDATDYIANVKIELYENGIFNMEISESTPNDGVYLWTVPNNLSDSLQYRIRIADASYPPISNDSLTFEIFNPFIEIINPISSTNWILNASEYIIWTSRGTVGDVKIELYNGSILELVISPTTSNDGSFLWVIPSNLTVSSEYTIKIVDVSNANIYYVSDSFTINIASGGGIPGYNLIITSVLIIGVTIILIKRKFFRRKYRQ
ncbi:hypothetical protein LCGC14_1891420, partial [marine sediment metagenome]